MIRRGDKEIAQLKEKLMLLEEQINNLKVIGVDDSLLMKKIMDIELMLDDMDVKVRANMRHFDSQIAEMRDISDVHFQGASDSMSAMKEIVMHMDQDRYELENEKAALFSRQKLLFPRLPLPKNLFAPIKKMLNRNVEMVRELLSADAPLSDPEPVPEPDIVPEPKPMPEEALKAEPILEDKALRYQREYEDYMEKYGKEPTAGSLVIERMFKKIDEKEKQPVAPAALPKIERKHRHKDKSIPLGELLETVEKQKNVKIKDAAKMFGVSQDELKNWAEMLQDNGLISIHGEEMRR